MKIKKYLEQSPTLAIHLAYENMIPQINKELKADDLNLLQGLVLTALFFEEREDVTPSQLAELFQTTRGNISHIVSHLEYKGWIKRIVKKDDARHFHLELKAEGRKKALTLIKYYDRLQDTFEKALGVSQTQKTVDGIRAIAKTFKESRSKS